MKKKNREINIFNLSMLDVICGAMGAFLAIMIILLPFYNKTNIDYRQMLREAQERLEREQARNRELERENEQQKEELNKTFLVIHISWNAKRGSGADATDIDLFVIDPKGKKFYYDQPQFPNHPGELSVDSKHAPGNEVWISRDAIPGEYKIMVNLYRKAGNNPTPVVTGKAVGRRGDSAFPEITLTEQCATEEGCPRLMATAVVDASGNVTVR